MTRTMLATCLLLTLAALQADTVTALKPLLPREWRGTNPIHAENSLASLNASGLPMLATTAVAVSRPMPGI